MSAAFEWQALVDAAALPPLTAKSIHVVRARLPDTSTARPDFGLLQQHLSPDEQQRAGRLHSETDRWHFAFARGLLRHVLGRYLLADPATIEFTTGIGGKPALGGVHGRSGLQFNVSHSGDWVVIAMARDMQLGIDIEQIRPAFRTSEIARRYFSAAENAALAALPEVLQVRAFFEGWSRKEAYVKARGAGLQLGLDTFVVSLAPGEPAVFLAGVDSAWTLIVFDLDPQTPGALVHDCAGARLVGFTL